jgi:hypothetical protein
VVNPIDSHQLVSFLSSPISHPNPQINEGYGLFEGLLQVQCGDHALFGLRHGIGEPFQLILSLLSLIGSHDVVSNFPTDGRLKLQISHGGVNIVDGFLEVVAFLVDHFNQVKE